MDGMNTGNDNRLTLLLVEDDPFIANVYKEKFENEGFKTLHALDGLHGLELALSEKVNIIVLDLMLPKLSGNDLLAKLREDERGKNIPVIVLTNLTEQEEAKKSLKLGAKEFLIKSDLTPSQLAEKVRAYVT